MIFDESTAVTAVSRVVALHVTSVYSMRTITTEWVATILGLVTADQCF
jgi:hypothetical protein